jgi:hypothetical protein
MTNYPPEVDWEALKKAVDEAFGPLEPIVHVIPADACEHCPGENGACEGCPLD